MKVELHVEVVRDFMSLIDPAGPCASHIQLLQCDDIGFALGNNFGNAGGIPMTIGAPAAMNIIGQKTQ